MTDDKQLSVTHRAMAAEISTAVWAVHSLFPAQRISDELQNLTRSTPAENNTNV